MTLEEYLPTIFGKVICIGGANGSGWIYYGECFEGITYLVAALSRREYERLQRMEREAKYEYENREKIYDKRIVSAEKELMAAEAKLQRLRAEKPD